MQPTWINVLDSLKQEGQAAAEQLFSIETFSEAEKTSEAEQFSGSENRSAQKNLPVSEKNSVTKERFSQQESSKEEGSLFSEAVHASKIKNPDASLSGERVTTRTTGELDDDTIRRQVGLTEESIPQLLQEQTGHYYFDLLNDTEQRLYVEIYQVLIHRGEDVRISSLDAAQIERVFQYVLNDHPEIFYVEGYHFTKYTLDEELKKITFQGSYHMDETEAEVCRKEIENRVNEWLQPLMHITDEYEYVRQVYESVIRHTDYVAGARDDQNICSVFLYGESVCQGYAKAMQYLLQKKGIQSALVIGSVEGEGHAWNLVRIDQDYYHIDVTWGDASYQLENEASAQGRFLGINYDYLCVTTDQMERTHHPDEPALMPLCKSLTANYYVREGAYFTDIDTALLEKLFAEAYAEGRDCVTLKCSEESVYQQMIQYLIEEQEIFHYLQERKDVVAYADHEDQLSISFWLSEE